jgi:hypothetical protein
MTFSFDFRIAHWMETSLTGTAATLTGIEHIACHKVKLLLNPAPIQGFRTNRRFVPERKNSTIFGNRADVPSHE